jgi:hypothetical protein
MEKAVGTAFYRNILQEYGRVNQPRLIRDAAVKQKVLLMLESVTRGIDRLEAVLKRIDPNTVQALLTKLQVSSRARLRTSRHSNTLCSASKNSPGQPNRMLEAIDLLAWHVRRRLDKTLWTAQPRQTAGLVTYFRCVAGLVIFYLERQELMDCRYCRRVFADNFHLDPFLSNLSVIRDFVLQALHRGHSRWGLRMNEHRYVEIALLEQRRNVVKMLPDSIAACLIFGVIGFDFDNASVFGENEVVCGHLVGKPHSLIATFFYTLLLGCVLGHSK